ncbi:hypothetical protein HHI36_013598 [Cryptolaemus montrouzieri]|uniref:p53 DNA-binding domain-containing protein n=1 Tax=Cryptolaemus montrouzieri TaxID=559131 RepID=A0ABD2NIZ4_9CUCU
MSFPESDFSDLLDKADAEELYKNVHEIVTYVEDNSYGAMLNDNMPDSFGTLDVEQTLDFKQEVLFTEYQLESDSLSGHPPQIAQQRPAVYDIPITVCSEEYSGPHNFEVSIIPNGSKNPWVFSPSLNKVFIDMGSHFPVDFRVSSRPSQGLFIRVMPSFSSLQHSQELVYRCVQHEQPQLNKNVPEHVRQHIIRCPSNGQAVYLGDRTSNKRLSIIFPLSYPQTGTDAVREMFVFVCKNSCPSGMNRKPIEIIFTLENSNGEILGRRILNVRICSCPKRDKEKEEKDHTNKGTAPYGKKRKLEGKVEKAEKKSTTNVDAKDRNVYAITLELPGKHNVQHVLKSAMDMMAGEALRNPQSNDVFMSCYKKLQVQLNQLQ